MRQLAWVGAVGALAWALGCSSGSSNDESVAACLRADLQAEAGAPAPEDLDPVEIVERDCSEAGLPGPDCDRDNWISATTAECIVRASDPPAGIWRTTLTFAAVTKRPIWDVRISVGNGVAKHFAVDAVTGGIVRRSTSTAIAD